MYDQPASCFRTSSGTPESTCDAEGKRSSAVTFRMRIVFWHAARTTPLTMAFGLQQQAQSLAVGHELNLNFVGAYTLPRTAPFAQ